MAESSAIPTLPGLAVETAEWLPSGAESGLVRVRGRWTDDGARQAELPVLALRADGGEHRFDSLPDARFSRDPASWRGTYLVPAALVASEPEAMWLEWGEGVRSGLSALERGIEPPPVAGPSAPAREPEGGEVIDRAVLAERRARRAEAAERQQARVAAEALKAVEVLELRSAELERRLEEAVAERDALAARQGEAEERRGALSAALASAAELRARSREWQLRMRTSEVVRAGDAVRLAVLEAERATTAPALRAALDEAEDAAVAARAALSDSDSRFADAHAAWDRRRDELESELREVRGALEQARGFETRLQVETVARTALEDELDRERAARAALRRDLELARAEATAGDDLRAERDAALDEAAAARADAATLPDLRSALDAARAEAAAVPDLRSALDAARAETAVIPDLRAELDAARAEAAAVPDLRSALDAARAEAAVIPDLRTELEAARRAAGETQQRIAELEQRAQSGRDELERLAREQADAAAAREPAADSTQLVADLDAAAEALRRREPVAPAEPAAPDAEPAVEWSETVDSERSAVTPGVEPPRSGEAEADVEWSPAAFPHEAVDVEPPAPDAEPYVEWSPPQTDEVAPAPPVEPEPPEAVEAVAVAEEPVVAPAGPKIVSAPGPPARGLMVGTRRRDYSLLRGAMVKLAHDDPRLAGRLLAALLPAQSAVLDGPLGYDITIRGTGTFGVAIAGARAGVEAITVPRGRHVAEFHLIADPLVFAELLAGVDHRIGRFFGPVRVRGRKRAVKALKALQTTTASFADAARAGADLDPELVYRTFAYAVHPTWTRGHDFTIAQSVAGDPPETWYLTARDGAGVAVSTTPPETPPAATVEMSRETFRKLLRDEPVQNGQRPTVHGDAHAVALMHEWTQRARGAH